MARKQRGALVALAAAAGMALTGCGGSTQAEGGDGAAFGECEVYGTAGSINLHPVTPDTLTVQTNLPSPGWWKGISPEKITGGYEYCLAANIAYRPASWLSARANIGNDVTGRTDDDLRYRGEGPPLTATYRNHLQVPAEARWANGQPEFQTLGGTLEAAAHYPNVIGSDLAHSAQIAFDLGIQRSSAVAILIALAAAVLSFRALHGVQRDD